MTEINPIRQAVQRLPGHWTQGTLHEYGTPNFCGLGHLYMALGHGDRHAGEALMADADGIVRNTHPYMKALANAAKDKFPDRSQVFVLFNDHPNTVEQDVIDVMTLAADRWDIEHDTP